MFDYIAGDDTQFEREPLTRLAAAEALMAHRHEGFWQCMDTLKEAQDLNALCRRGATPSCSSKRLQQEDKCHMDPAVLILLFRVLILVLDFLILFLDE